MTKIAVMAEPKCSEWGGLEGGGDGHGDAGCVGPRAAVR